MPSASQVGAHGSDHFIYIDQNGRSRIGCLYVYGLFLLHNGHSLVVDELNTVVSYRVHTSLSPPQGILLTLYIILAVEATVGLRKAWWICGLINERLRREVVITGKECRLTSDRRDIVINDDCAKVSPWGVEKEDYEGRRWASVSPANPTSSVIYDQGKRRWNQLLLLVPSPLSSLGSPWPVIDWPGNWARCTTKLRPTPSPLLFSSIPCRPWQERSHVSSIQIHPLRVCPRRQTPTFLASEVWLASWYLIQYDNDERKKSSVVFVGRKEIYHLPGQFPTPKSCILCYFEIGRADKISIIWQQPMTERTVVRLLFKIPHYFPRS